MLKNLLLSVSILAGSLVLHAEESLVRVSSSLSTVKAYSGGFFTVKIKIERRSLDSFFMIEQDIPEGMEISGIESNGAQFEFEEGKIKYTWLRLPKDDEIQVMYKVKVPAGMLGRKVFQGSYYYILDEEKQVFNLPEMGIDIVEHISPTDTDAERSMMAMVNNDPAYRPDFVNRESDLLEYRIQILSSTNRLNKDSIRTNYKIKEKLNEESFNGLYKYTTGNFKSYEKAKEYKDKLSYQKYIPFVIAYHNGTRISLGEAMQIASKKRPVAKN